ncbi:5-carboxymethyl-2-hydroxymuconate Delta-isomerase [Methylobacterium crusticola]|uniref:5-carboxymethyl-2-hydroxymuconate Delta-isomerase n=1 Tax=Methylobacterium crusticola TaxID=1697972 RepID=A0ABQ4QVT1_9HYPH|nr:5-carboxymethyl-2-hydroxymuconate Delta-isomerase [Methylobacterium crusticola]GJD49151.1 5-carboxymethyl-2-hydroxymuconate Delta-isomerase [Methylobacterium crusticola]
MPHIVVEYSANLEAQVPPRRLVDALHGAALGTGVFPVGGLRTRAERRDVYAVADGDPGHAFVAVRVRMGAGRDAATRRRVAEDLMRVLEAETAEAFASRGLGLSVDVEEIDPVASLKTNNLHERIAAREGAR